MPDTLLGAQVVLRRNFQDQSFVGTMLEADKTACSQRVAKSLDELPSVWTQYPMRDITRQDIAGLQQRAPLPEELWANKSASMFLREDDQAMVLVNLEDHVQVRVQADPEDTQEAIRQAKEVARHLENQWPFARDENLGWLTARPVLAGSGLQIVMHLHLPMLSMMQQVKGLTEAIGKEQLFELKAAPGQEEKNPAALYTLSSMFSAYGSTRELAQAAERKAQELDRKESNLRDKILVRSSRSTYVDQVWRAFGILKYARRLTENEFLALWSKLRLGVVSGLIPMPLEQVNLLREKASNPALRELQEGGGDDHGIHFIRADVVRAELNGGH